MITFFEWFSGLKLDSRPWAVLGQGPSFSRHVQFPELDHEYYLMGINRACRARKTLVTHIVDLHVLGDVPGIEEKTDYIVMPWYPHQKWQRTDESLEAIAERVHTLRAFRDQGRLLWYNLSTTSKAKAKPGCPVVGVTWFSTEAAVRLLAMAGVKVIRTLGIDGGRWYAPEFQDTKPLKAGHHTYSLQDQELKKIVSQYNLDMAKLC